MSAGHLCKWTQNRRWWWWWWTGGQKLSKNATYSAL